MEFEILKNYQKIGSFVFNDGDVLKVRSKDVPNDPGVYLIYTHKSDLLYIGSSGTWFQEDNGFGKQGLLGRLNNTSNGVRRQQYFTSKIQEEGLNKLIFNWFVTYCGGVKDLPGYVEALLIQQYFIRNGCLPKWNKRFPG